MIRKYTKEDLEQVMKIWLETNVEAHAFIPKAYWEGRYEMVKETVASSLESEVQIFVAEDEGKIKGFIGLLDGYIEGLFVNKEWQKKGIGYQLVEHAKKDYTELSLKVYEKNEKAIAFYKRQGFEVIEQDYEEATNESEFLMKFTRK